MNMNELSSLLNRFAIILTPHITKPLPMDGYYPDELTILKAGTFNTGFIGMANVQEALKFLSWWKKRLWHFGLMKPAEGMYVDQKWIDFVPSLFDKVHILKNPAYNVGYWNLHERKLSSSDGRILVNGELLRFFHFSGFDPNNSDAMPYQTRYKVTNIAALRHLFKLYKNRLLHSRYSEVCTWPYCYNHFDNGIPIPEKARIFYRELGRAIKKFGNPFKTASRNSFYKYYINTNSIKNRCIYRIAEFWHKYRSLFRRFPIIEILAIKSSRFIARMKS